MATPTGPTTTATASPISSSPARTSTSTRAAASYRDVLTNVYLNSPDPNTPPGVFRLDELAKLTGRIGGGVAWGDYNRDGTPDIALSGRDKKGQLKLELYVSRGRSGIFDNTSIQLDQSNAVAGKLTFADFDNDGWLDLLSAGRQANGTGALRIYRNNTASGMQLLSLTPAPPRIH